MGIVQTSVLLNAIKILHLSATLVHSTLTVIIFSIWISLESRFETEVVSRTFELDQTTGQASIKFKSLLTFNPAIFAWLFTLVCTLDHLFSFLLWRIKLPIIGRFYKDNLRNYKNNYRWLEYSISSTLMIILIECFFRIVVVEELVYVIGLNISMILFGQVYESVNYFYRKKVDGRGIKELVEKTENGRKIVYKHSLTSFVFGFIPLVSIWSIYFSSFFTTGTTLPTFVYIAVFGTFILFNCFPIALFIQMKEPFDFENYLKGEVCFIILSLVAKSLLAITTVVGIYN